MTTEMSNEAKQLENYQNYKTLCQLLPPFEDTNTEEFNCLIKGLMRIGSMQKYERVANDYANYLRIRGQRRQRSEIYHETSEMLSDLLKVTYVCVFTSRLVSETFSETFIKGINRPYHPLGWTFADSQDPKDGGMFTIPHAYRVDQNGLEVVRAKVEAGELGEERLSDYYTALEHRTSNLKV